MYGFIELVWKIVTMLWNGCQESDETTVYLKI